MANIRISQLPTAPDAITGAELVPIVQNGVTVQTTVSDITNSPSQTQTFLTTAQEPSLPNSRYIGGGLGIGTSNGGSQGLYSLFLNGTSGSLENASTGLIVKSGVNTVVNRLIAAGTAGLSVTNGSGVSGNPTLSLTDLALSIATLTGSGMVSLVSGSYFQNVTLTGSTNQITIVNPNGGSNPTFSISSNPVIPGTAGMVVPSGTTGQRALIPTNGQMRYNTTSSRFEFYEGSVWATIGTGDGTVTEVFNVINQTSVINGTTTPSIGLASNPIIPGTSAVTLPKGATAQRTGSPASGMMRYNTQTEVFEGYTSTGWNSFSTSGGVTTFSAGSTGLTPSSATAGPITLGGVLNVVNGGTGASTSANARINLLPTYAGNANKRLTVNGAETDVEWVVDGGGTVTSVTGTAPVSVATGTTTPVISMAAATTSVNGYLTSTDWNTFNGKQPAGTYVNSVSGTAGRITSTGGVTPVIDLASGVATAGTTGSATLIPVVTIDTYGRVTGITTAANPQGTVTSVTGTAPVVSSGGATPAISMPAATTSVNGYLTSTDWTTFNNKSNTNGTVTSVAATAGTGISVSGSPITTSGTLTITNTAPDQTVAFTNGTGISVTGTYPNFTVTNTAPSSGGTVTSVTGTAPVVSSGGATPAISMAAATTSVNGYLTSTDWTTFNNKSDTVGTVTSVVGTGTVNGITLTGTVTSSGNLTLGGTLGSIGNSQLSNSAITVGTTAISLGASSTTLAGLTSVSSTSFTGALTGNASTASTLATARNIAGVSFNGSADIAIPLDNLSDVTIATPTVDQILKYNGSDWVNGAANSISGGAGIEFFNATPIITAAGTNNALQILTLSQTPVTTAEQTTSTASINGTVAGSAWLSPALGRTTIDAGIWDYTVFASVNNIGGVNTTITRQMYAALPFVTGTVTTTGTGTSRTATASAGTPFAVTEITASATNTLASYLQTPQGLYQITARASDTSVTITTLSTYVNESAVAGTVWKLLFAMPTSPVLTTTIAQYDNTSTQPAFTVTALTKLAGITFVISTGVRTVTTTYNGTARNTHISSPLAVLHNQLGGLQGGTATENYHLTDTEYTGTGTGVFARAASPTFTGTLTGATIVATIGIFGGTF